MHLQRVVSRLLTLSQSEFDSVFNPKHSTARTYGAGSGGVSPAV